jgi:septal ring factor EnvC (AmiA/AmiB activator)
MSNEPKSEPSQWAIEKAAQVWCMKGCTAKVMDPELALAFAHTLNAACAAKDAELSAMRGDLAASNRIRDDARQLRDVLLDERYAKDAEIARLKAGGCARDQSTTQFCAEAVALQAEVARLKELDEQNGRYIEQIKRESGEWRETARIHQECIAALTALMERVPHVKTGPWVANASHGGLVASCAIDCIACAMAKLQAQWKEGK